MNTSGEKSNGLRGIAALLDAGERKTLFRKYLYFLCWVELGILLTCWLYQIGGTVSTFPWRLYFLIAFIAPIAISFIVGTIVVGFNKYFGEPEEAGADGLDREAAEGVGTGKIQQITRMVAWLQRLPFLALLLLLGVGAALFYKIDAIVGLMSSIGGKSVNILVISLGVLLLLAAIFALVLIILNYRLRKTAMEYQYRAEVAEKLGLVILQDNTVVHSSGKLLVNGGKFKKGLQLLPEAPDESKAAEAKSGENTAVGSIPRAADLET